MKYTCIVIQGIGNSLGRRTMKTKGYGIRGANVLRQGNSPQAHRSPRARGWSTYPTTTTRYA
eukprot:7472316-Pyramimonas_sp.AAC.1